MAEGLMLNTIEKLIGKLGSMAVEAWNVGDDVEKLVESMSEIKAVILDAEEQQQQQGGTNKSHQVKLWLVKLKDALYDAGDLLDDFSTEHLRRQVMTKNKKVKKVRIFFSSSNQILFSFNMAPKIKDLRKRIEDLNVDRRVFNFTNRTPELRVVKLRETHSFIREEEVTGREEEKKELIDLLLNTDNNGKEKENVSVISIIGIGGLGKTALAQLVYNDKSVQKHFELKMWVCVADEDSDVKGFDGNIDEMEKDDIILQGLHVHPNVKVLEIKGFGGVTFSNSVNSFTNLSKLTLSDCRRLQYLPPILHLKTLTLWGLPCLKWIVNDSNNVNGSSSTLSPLLTEIYLIIFIGYLPLKDGVNVAKKKCKGAFVIIILRASMLYVFWIVLI